MGKRLIVALVAAGLLAGSCKAQTVVLTSDPPGATILLRGAVEVGRTPLSLHLLPGLPMENYVSVGIVGAANGHGDAGKGASSGAPL
jgi:hypothetical protein